eukprot:1176249-Prorocentrum_minimum.AAC.1
MPPSRVRLVPPTTLDTACDWFPLLPDAATRPSVSKEAGRCLRPACDWFPLQVDASVPRAIGSPYYTRYRVRLVPPTTLDTACDWFPLQVDASVLRVIGSLSRSMPPSCM